MEDMNSIIEKIKKLFSLSTSPNANEASIALAKAYSMLTYYNLSEKDLNIEKPTTIIDSPYLEGKKIRQWKISLVIELATINYCQAYRNIAIGTDNKISTMLINLVGTETNVNSTKIMADYIFNAIDHYATRMGLEPNNIYFNNSLSIKGRLSVEAFKVGYATTIIERLKTIKVMNNNPQTKELVIVLDKQITDHMNGMKLEKTVTDVNINDINSYVLGRKEGTKLSLSKQIASEGNLEIE